MTDQDRHYEDELQIPFLFVPHGDPFPTEWVREHPDYVRIPAIMLPRGTGCKSYEQACAWLQAREEEKKQREAQTDIDRAPVSGFGRSYALGAPPMVRRPGRMMRGGPPPKYPGGLGAPEGERWVGPDPVGAYLGMNAAMMEFAANYRRGIATGYRQPPSSLVLEANGLSGLDRSYVYVNGDQTDPTRNVGLAQGKPHADAATIQTGQNNQAQVEAPHGQGQTEVNHQLQLAADDGTPGDNQRQNRQVRDIVKMLNLNKDQQNELHDEISKKSFGFPEILGIARRIFWK